MAERPLLFWQRVRAIGPWRSLALVVALGLVTYNALLGVRWWGAERQVASLAIQVRQGLATTPSHTPSAEDRTRELAERERLWQEARQPFLLSAPEDLAQRLVATAQETGASLTSIALGDPQSKSVEGIQYTAQPVTLGLRGEPASLSGFLSRLGVHIPSAAVVAVSLSDLAHSPAAQVQLLVYLSPQPVQKGGK